MILYADWSSTALNLALVHPDGRLAERRHSSVHGATSIAPADYPEHLAGVAGDWLDAAEAVYVSGMATGRGNWHETGYVPAPAELGDLHAAAVRKGTVHNVPVLLLPGLFIDSPLPDVMRGEELKIWGLAEAGFDTVVLPGRHSKWARIGSGRIERFATFLSGEITALLRQDSIVSRLIPSGAAVSDAGVAAGLEAWGRTRSCGGGVLRAVFSARSAVLAEQLSPVDIPGYLYALVCAAEVEEARAEFIGKTSAALALVGEPQVCEPFAMILEHLNIRSCRFDGLEMGARAVAVIHRLKDVETRVHIVEQPNG